MRIIRLSRGILLELTQLANSCRPSSRTYQTLKEFLKSWPDLENRIPVVNKCADDTFEWVKLKPDVTTKASNLIGLVQNIVTLVLEGKEMDNQLENSISRLLNIDPLDKSADLESRAQDESLKDLLQKSKQIIQDKYVTLTLMREFRDGCLNEGLFGELERIVQKLRQLNTPAPAFVTFV